METFIKQFLRIKVLLILSFLLTSSAYGPTLEQSRNNDKTEIAQSKRQKRLLKKKARFNRKLNKLSAKLDQARHTKQKQRLKNKLAKVKRPKHTTNKHFAGFSLFFGISAFIIPLFIILVGIFSGGVTLFITWILGLALGIAAIFLGKRGKKLSTKPSLHRRMSIAGYILGIIASAAYALVILIYLIGLTGVSMF